MPALHCLLTLASLPLLSTKPAAILHQPHALLAPATMAIRFRELIPRVLIAPPAPLPAPLAMREDAHYKVSYGVIGGIGQLHLTIENERTDGKSRLVTVTGRGEGSVLGLGRSEKRVNGEFDAATLLSRRWTMARTSGDTVIDSIDQPSAGVLNMIRQRPNVAPAPLQATFTLPALDPVGLIMRLRVAPPAVDHPVQVLMLDGQALYRVTLTAAGRQAVPDMEQPTTGLRVDGRADPIFYNGSDATSDRPRRTFTLWLSDDDARIPLRLTMPIGPGDVVVSLVEASRSPRSNTK